MILIRDVFQLKFGKSKEAVAAWKEGLAMFEKAGMTGGQTRLLTDLVGNYYTLVFEAQFESLTAWEEMMKTHMGKQEWKDWHAKVLQYNESGHREIFNIVQ
ncbi:MAG: hypothetical protein H6839_00510 [Planctomycetes bacterium]|nr:hypothetical protein [Planctomycetota bacterium]